MFLIGRGGGGFQPTHNSSLHSTASADIISLLGRQRLSNLSVPELGHVTRRERYAGMHGRRERYAGMHGMNVRNGKWVSHPDPQSRWAVWRAGASPAYLAV